MAMKMRIAAILFAGVAAKRTQNDIDGVQLEVQGSRPCTQTVEAPGYSDLKLVGEGANGCVYIGTADKYPGIKVAFKTSKHDGKMNTWKRECDTMQRLHRDACAKGEDAKKLMENYVPTCLEVGGTDQDPYLVMHATGTTEMKDFHELAHTKEDKISLFAQLVASIHAMHNIGLTHNDLHAKNVMLEETGGAPRLHLALIDFGDVAPLSKQNPANVYRTGYKRDAFAIWRFGGNLGDCAGAIQLGDTTKNMEKEAFLSCMQDHWAPGDDFMAALRQVVEATEQGTQQQHVTELYETSFVQEHLPELKQYYPLLDDECKGGEYATDAVEVKRPETEPSSGETDEPTDFTYGGVLHNKNDVQECEAKCRSCGSQRFACLKGRSAGACSGNSPVAVSDCSETCDCLNKQPPTTSTSTTSTTTEATTTEATTTETTTTEATTTKATKAQASTAKETTTKKTEASTTKDSKKDANSKSGAFRTSVIVAPAVAAAAALF